MHSNVEANLADARALSHTLAAATSADDTGMQDVDVHNVARMIGKLMGEAIDQPVNA